MRGPLALASPPWMSLRSWPSAMAKSCTGARCHWHPPFDLYSPRSRRSCRGAWRRRSSSATFCSNGQSLECDFINQVLPSHFPAHISDKNNARKCLFFLLEMDEIASTSSVNIPEGDFLGGWILLPDGHGSPPGHCRSRQGRYILRPHLSPAPRRAEVW